MACGHLKSRTKIYNVWQGMKARCLNPNDKSYPRYGGRGITICAEWKDDFQTFFDYVSSLEHFGEDGYSLDRINNDGDYKPDNVKWSTRQEQACNRRSNVVVEYQGEKMLLSEAAEKSGVNISTLRYRLQAGESGEELFRPKYSKPCKSGEDVYNAELSNETAAWCREVYVPYDKEFGATALAKKLGKKVATIWAAVSGKHYKKQ